MPIQTLKISCPLRGPFGDPLIDIKRAYISTILKCAAWLYINLQCIASRTWIISTNHIYLIYLLSCHPSQHPPTPTKDPHVSPHPSPFNCVSYLESQHHATMMRSITLAPACATLPRAIRPRNGLGLVVHANTLWTLAPRQSKAQFFDTSRTSVDLTGTIGARR